jgi:hypothetical protein
MHVYVMATSEFGPSKVGISAAPEKRQRGLQTGHPEQIIVHYRARVRDECEARMVEQIAHRSLRLVRAEAGNEWFKLPTAEAMIAVRHAAALIGALHDPAMTLDALSRKAAVSWLKSIEDYRAALDDEGRDSTTIDDLQAPDLLEVLACLRRPAASSFSFNHYLDTWPEGPWHRAIQQNLGRVRCSGSSFLPYLEVADILVERNIDEGSHVSCRWIEWSLARDLTASERTLLSEIWNTFAERYNAIELADPYVPEHGRDDRVDDVELFALINDPRHPGRQCAIFCHEHFRAVLLPRRALELHSYDRLARSVLRPLSGAIAGFVAPVIRQSLWSEPLVSWLHKTPTCRDAALARFLGNSLKQYPELGHRQPVEYGKALALIYHELPRVELTGAW